MLKFTTVTENVVDHSALDTLITQIYGRTFSYQQQDGCKSRSRECISVPIPDPYDYENDTVEEVVNGNEMGVSFKAWLERDPNKPLPTQRHDFELGLWWKRNFYPHIDMVLNDLYEKGFIPEGDYVIDIDW